MESNIVYLLRDPFVVKLLTAIAGIIILIAFVRVLEKVAVRYIKDKNAFYYRTV